MSCSSLTSKRLVAGNDRRYLQPIDIWIGRIAEYLNPNLTFGRDRPAVISQYLADACEFAGISGVAFNQGSWYFGSHVAGSALRLNRLLDEMAGGKVPRAGMAMALDGEEKVFPPPSQTDHGGEMRAGLRHSTDLWTRRACGGAPGRL